MFKKINTISISNSASAKLVLFFLNILFFLFLVLCCFFNKVCSANSSQIETIEPGVLTVGTNATLQPFEFVDSNNTIIGFDVDFMEKIAENVGLKLKIVNEEFDSLIPSIVSKKIDLAVAALTKTPEREKVVAFSIPYYSTSQGVLVLNDAKFENELDFENQTIAVQQGTISQTTVENLKKSKNLKLKIRTYSDYNTMIEELLNSRVNAVVLDRDTGRAHQRMHSSNLKFVDGTNLGWPDEFNCIACSKQNVALLDAVNEQIKTLKNSDFYKALVEKYVNYAASFENQNNQEQAIGKMTLIEKFNTAFLKNNRWQTYLNGLAVTLVITFFAAFLGMTIGAALAVLQVLSLKKLNFLKFFLKLYIDLIRGTPLLLQLFIWWFAILPHSRQPVLVAIIACGLNSSAYVCEIVRGAICSIDKGQTEAGLAIGFSSLQSLFKIVIPQSLKNSIPALCNEIVSLLKETAIVGYIAIVDLTRAADQIRAATYLSFMPLLITAAIYFILTKAAKSILNLVERKMS